MDRAQAHEGHKVGGGAHSSVAQNGYALTATPTYIGANRPACHHDAEAEFTNVGEDIFTADYLVNGLYETYAALMSKRIQSSSFQLGMIGYGSAIRNGLYIPGVKRPLLSGQIDLTNDGVPDYAGFVWLDPLSSPSLMVVQKAKFPRGVIRPCAGQEIWISQLGTHLSYPPRDDTLGVKHFHGVVRTDGSIVPAVYKDKEYDARLGAGGKAVLLLGAAITINASADRRHLWNVQTGEVIYDKPTVMTVGVNEEHVKSLFYARDLPVTASGRKRPILHWVQAHQRRIKAGTEIDVSKHLRGVDKFEMGGFNFAITNPMKPTLRRSAPT